MANCSTGAAHSRLGYHRKLDGEPALEPGQWFITGGQHTDVFEHASQVVDRFVGTGFVEAGMGQRDRPAGQAPQQLLDSGRAFPGQDAGGPVDPAQGLHDRGHSVAVLSAVDHHRGQVLAKGAAGTGCASVDVAFCSAVSTGEVAGNSCARQTDRLPACVAGKAGEDAVVAALGADTASVHG